LIRGRSLFLKAHNCNVVLSGLSPGTPDTSPSKERVFELLRDVDAWIVATAPVTREMLASFPKLKVIAKRGVGYDQIDVAAAKESAGSSPSPPEAIVPPTTCANALRDRPSARNKTRTVRTAASWHVDFLERNIAPPHSI